VHTVAGTERVRSNRRLRHSAALLAVASLLAFAAQASSAAGGSQQVGGVVEPQFGVAVQSDGTISGNSSTIAVKVTRSVEHGAEVITIAPRE
jgi:uncharacterized membrane protein